MGAGRRGVAVLCADDDPGGRGNTIHRGNQRGGRTKGDGTTRLVRSQQAGELFDFEQRRPHPVHLPVAGD
jgi:hypothetical protein